MENAESKNAILKIMLEIVICELMQENKTHAFMRLHISMTNYKSVFGIRFFFSQRDHIMYFIELCTQQLLSRRNWLIIIEMIQRNWKKGV